MDGYKCIVCPDYVFLTLLQRKGLLELKIVRALGNGGLHRDENDLWSAGCGSAILDSPEGGNDWWHSTGIAMDHGMTSRDYHASAR